MTTDATITGGMNAPAVAGASAIPPEELDRLTDDIVAALKTVYDPEIPADIYELGLIYKVDIADDRKVAIDMTLPRPAARWRARCRAGSRTPSARWPACRPAR